MSLPERSQDGNPSDEFLMERLKEGDSSMLEPLVRRYERPLFAYACRVLRDRERAQDVFQETFVRVFRRRETFREGARFRPWLYQICLNLCRDALRKQSRQSETELKDELPLPDTRPGPEEYSQRKALAEQVRAAIMGLPDKHREVLLLVQYQGLSYPEIADMLDIPVGTVKSRVFHAYKKLASELKGLEEPAR
ncbi:MAG: RNA polymerase sigma factor [Armatimonadetes bacterium]|nr:RNA polymerase sigma factor [Armatimonadota bacterium]